MNKHWKRNLLMLLIRVPFALILNPLILIGETATYAARKLNLILPTLKKDYDK